MAKAVLISIRPKWCELIAKGKKTIEFRKTRPTLQTRHKVYIYETRGFERVGNDNLNCVVGGNGRGAVIGEFVIDGIGVYKPNVHFTPTNMRYTLRKFGCITPEELWEYSGGKDVYGWYISDLIIYDVPKKVADFQRACVHSEDCCTCKRWSKKEYACIAGITRPPQSWMYVEEIKC